MRDLLAATSARAPVFHCFGLHEWAMLYRPPGAEEGGVDKRSVHQALPLRISQEEVMLFSRCLLCLCFKICALCGSGVRVGVSHL